MKHARLLLTAIFLIAMVGLPAIASAQPRLQDRSMVLLGQDYSLPAGETVEDIVVMGGSAAVAGQVAGDLVVVLGNADIASTASISGDLVVVAGSAAIADGARVGGDLVIVGGTVDPPGSSAVNGERVIVGTAAIGRALRSFAPWISRGLFLGRPIVPDLPWIWAIVAVAFVLYAGLNYLFDGAVTAAAATIGEKPLTTFLSGLLVMLLVGPVTLLLLVSVIGVIVVPFLQCAVLIAWVVGKISVDRWLGSRLMAETADGSKTERFRSFAIGFVAIVLAYMVPVLGFVTWTIVSVLALGAATLALIEGYRREHPEVATSPVTIAASSVPSSSLGAAGTPAAAPTAAPVSSDVVSFPRGAFLERLAAFVLDAILVMIVSRVFDPLRHGPGGTMLLMLVYHIGFWAWKGTTVGGIICQLRIVRVDGTPMRFADALVRGLSSIFSMAVLGLGFLWILRDPDRQAWHDKIAGTWVVKVPRNYPL